MVSRIYLCISFSLLVRVIRGCRTVQMNSDALGSITLNQIPLNNEDDLDVLSVGAGRPSYVAFDDRQQKSYYLYHSVSPTTSTGSWVLNDEFGISGHAIGYRYSWAVAPHLIESVNDNYIRGWIVPAEEGWRADPSMTITCLDENVNESTLYFESSPIQPTLTGFYVQRVVSGDNSMMTYSHIPQHQSIELSFLYKMGDLWLIGEQYGAESGFAYIESSASSPILIDSVNWNFVDRDDPENWSTDKAYVLYNTLMTPQGPKSFPTVYEAVRFAHSIKYVPKGQDFVFARNRVPVPALGLGTGGINPDHANDIFHAAILEGYRFFDLAREYGNEHVLPEIFERLNDSFPIAREDLFIQSKVWPTDLGFHPTMDALLVSLDLLRTSFIDSYLIHWPECMPSWSWMHCETTVDPEGTWKGSWRALEKAYSEGFVNSIGVSNFNRALLEELTKFAIVQPHFVQNFAEPGQLDLDVRKFCEDFKILYQPYASGRNIQFLPDDIKTTVYQIAEKHSKSPYAVILRFFLQSGSTIVIPRSNDINHLQDNVKVFDWKLDDEDMVALGWGDNLRNEL